MEEEGVEEAVVPILGEAVSIHLVEEAFQEEEAASSLEEVELHLYQVAWAGILRVQLEAWEASEVLVLQMEGVVEAWDENQEVQVALEAFRQEVVLVVEAFLETLDVRGPSFQEVEVLEQLMGWGLEEHRRKAGEVCLLARVGSVQRGVVPLQSRAVLPCCPS